MFFPIQVTPDANARSTLTSALPTLANGPTPAPISSMDTRSEMWIHITSQIAKGEGKR